MRAAKRLWQSMGIGRFHLQGVRTLTHEARR